MSIRLLIAVVIRVLAIFLAWRAVTMMPDLLTANATGATWWIAAAALGSGVLAAMLLWFFNLDLAKLLLRNIRDEPVAFSNAELEVALFAAIGLWIFIRGVMDAMWWLSFVWFLDSAPYANVTLSPEQRADIVVVALELLFGAAVALKAVGIRGLLRRLRDRGSVEHPD